MGSFGTQARLKADRCDIGWAESMLWNWLSYGLYKLATSITTSVVHGDNMGVIGAFSKRPLT